MSQQHYHGLAHEDPDDKPEEGLDDVRQQETRVTVSEQGAWSRFHEPLGDNAHLRPGLRRRRHS